jgi:hypothetical protein
MVERQKQNEAIAKQEEDSRRQEMLRSSEALRKQQEEEERRKSQQEEAEKKRKEMLELQERNARLAQIQGYETVVMNAAKEADELRFVVSRIIMGKSPGATSEIDEVLNKIKALERHGEEMRGLANKKKMDLQLRDAEQEPTEAATGRQSVGEMRKARSPSPPPSRLPVKTPPKVPTKTKVNIDDENLDEAIIEAKKEVKKAWTGGPLSGLTDEQRHDLIMNSETMKKWGDRPEVHQGMGRQKVQRAVEWNTYDWKTKTKEKKIKYDDTVGNASSSSSSSGQWDNSWNDKAWNISEWNQWDDKNRRGWKE